MKPYVPDRGDICWLNPNPQSGHEQSGKRPVLVLSPKVYNSITKLFIICPITTSEKGYPYEVKIPSDIKKVKGVVLTDQIKSLDWSIREAKFICKFPDVILEDVKQKIRTLVF